MLHVVLVEPEIPWNTGNAGRTCLAAGAKLHLVRPLGFHLGERWLRRAGLDYWEHVDPVVHDSFAAFEAELPRLGVPFFMSVEGPQNLFDLEIPDEAVFVFGSEGKGLAPEVRERYGDRLTRLPIVEPRARSLNLSTAVGVTIYEALRRRR
ncbi:MAG TPA: tRNA (cytidine(34)-2'-O)-methyltransferase [Planctomycetota bacterium]|nr:tRNA (cytidine(34)-2'-O)-methyltransferase [Planctomycetota bacterium]